MQLVRDRVVTIDWPHPGGRRAILIRGSHEMRLFVPAWFEHGEPDCPMPSILFQHTVWHRPANFLAALAVGFGLAVPSLVEAQSGGAITGIVTDAATGQPVQQARVLVSGTQLGTLTAENGRYTIRVPSAGTVTLDISRIGYTEQKVEIALAAGETVTKDVSLQQAAFSLAAVVTTVTGQQRKVEMANATAQVNVAEQIAELPVTNLGALVSGRSSGVQAVATGTTGAGSRIRIRGQNSFSLSNDPILIIDGVRASNLTGDAIGTGGSGPSRLDDINPNEIESLEIVKGPSAATLYGTEAANGVIVITTKRGKAGKTSWNLGVERGRIDNTRRYPDLWTLWGRKAANPNVTVPCLLPEVASGKCMSVDSLSHGIVMHVPDLTPLDVGSREQYNLQASGGNDRVQFFVSGQTEGETGIYKMPKYEEVRLKQQRAVDALPSDIMRPNALARNNFRANVNAEIRPNMFLQVSSGYINSNLRLPRNDDHSTGIVVIGIGGPWRDDLKDAFGNQLHGYRNYMMGDIFSQTTTQGINRFINTASLQWNPLSWLATRAALGADLTNRDDMYISKVGEGPAYGTTRLGEVTAVNGSNTQQTVDYGGTGTFQLASWLNSKTSIGMQYVRRYTSMITSTGVSLPPGGTTVSAAATRSTSQNIGDTRTLGYYVEQMFGVNDKFFLTAGLRRDAASAFGVNTRAVYYPKIGASWLISDASFFPQYGWLNSLRLRGTYGASGQIPDVTAGLRSFTPYPLTLIGSEAPGASLTSLGNANLKPEYSAETELGFDLQMFQGRTNIEFTTYDKSTTDALIQREIAQSLSGLSFMTVNVGNIRNSGVELTWNQRLFDRDAAALSFTFTGSTLKNRMVKLGEGISPVPSGNRNTQRNLAGYPLFGFWNPPIGGTDTNGDGIISETEFTVGDTAVYLGSSIPTKEMSFTPTLELFNKKLRVSTQFDGKFDLKKLNNTLRHQCQVAFSCRGRADITAPLDMQVTAMGVTKNVYTGFFEDGSFVRWREMTVSYEMPGNWANKLRASRWNMILTARNLGVMTNYSGVDPEAAVSQSDTRGGEDFFSTPPLRILMLRMNFSF